MPQAIPATDDNFIPEICEQWKAQKWQDAICSLAGSAMITAEVALALWDEYGVTEARTFLEFVRSHSPK
jgi:hypothetical protein